MRRFLLIPHLKIHNANAISSPYTIGFPAMTAWMGAVHALQRHVNQQGMEKIRFTKLAVSCHSLDLQTYKGKGDYVHSIIGTSNPLDEDGKRPSFIEEARCHVDVSLLIECTGYSVHDDKIEDFEIIVEKNIHKMKWAGGDLLSVFSKGIKIYPIDEDDDQEVRKLINKLMLGHILIERRDLMIENMKEEKDALTAMLDYLKVTYQPDKSIDDEEVERAWICNRKSTGWLAPIAVGFQGISQLGSVKNQRDVDTLHRFSESIITLGEFVMPYRVQNLDDMLWQYHVDHEKNLYLCKNKV